MRAILAEDLDAAARVLAALPPAARDATADRLLQEAHAADKFRKATGRVHTRWGPGTLAGAAQGHAQQAQPRRYVSVACAALAAVLSALARWRNRAAPGI